VAGPLVPGPGGIPLFLIGFALISFPGKRRLTARVLRGKPVRFQRGPFVLIGLDQLARNRTRREATTRCANIRGRRDN
jgi:hypothetical protein